MSPVRRRANKRAGSQTAQRERLAFLATHQPSEIRREAHVTPAELEQAIAGEAVGTEIVGRLATVLTSG
jgi:hypothetical protein